MPMNSAEFRNPFRTSPLAEKGFWVLVREPEILFRQSYWMLWIDSILFPQSSRMGLAATTHTLSFRTS